MENTRATVKNVAAYSVTVSGGAQIDPGAIIEDLEMDKFNDQLVERGHLIVVQSDVIRTPEEG